MAWNKRRWLLILSYIACIAQEVASILNKESHSDLRTQNQKKRHCSVQPKMLGFSGYSGSWVLHVKTLQQQICKTAWVIDPSHPGPWCQSANQWWRQCRKSGWPEFQSGHPDFRCFPVQKTPRWPKVNLCTNPWPLSGVRVLHTNSLRPGVVIKVRICNPLTPFHPSPAKEFCSPHSMASNHSVRAGIGVGIWKVTSVSQSFQDKTWQNMVQKYRL